MSKVEKENKESLSFSKICDELTQAGFSARVSTDSDSKFVTLMIRKRRKTSAEEFVEQILGAR